MASEKTAAVKLTLDGSNYLSNLRKVGQQNAEVAARAQSAWKKMGVAGLESVKRSAAETWASVRGSVKMIAGIGGAATLGGAIKGALDLRSEFKKLAFDVKAGSGQIVQWDALLKEAQEQGIKWGVSTEDLGKAFGEIRDETGSIDYAREAMKAVAVTSRGTGADVHALAGAASSLGEKFGVTGAQAGEALAAVYSMAHQGNIPLEEMDSVIDRIGSSAKLAGVQGVQGFKQIMGLANIAKESSKNLRGALAGVMGLEEEIARPEFGKKIAAQFGIATRDAKGEAKEMTSVLAAIFAKTGGKKEALAQAFQGEQLKIVNEIAEPFRAAFETTSGDVNTKTKAALAALRAKLDEASTTYISAADIAKEAQQRTKGPSAQMAIAMERLKAAFTKPEMIDGLVRLAKVAPLVAQKMADLLEMAFEHPAMAAGIVLGLKAGVPFLTGAISAGGRAIASQIAAAVMGEGAGAVAGKVAGAAARGGGGIVPVPAGAMGVLGKGIAIAGAALAGYEIGKAFTDYVEEHATRPAAANRDALQGATMAAEMNATGKANPQAAAASVKELRAKLDIAKRDREGIAGVLNFQGTAGSEDIGRAERALAKARTASGEDIHAFVRPGEDRIREIVNRAGTYGQQGFVGPTLPAGEDQAAKAVDELPAKLGKQTLTVRVSGPLEVRQMAPAASRGPRPVGPVTPGYAPR